MNAQQVEAAGQAGERKNSQRYNIENEMTFYIKKKYA